MSSTTLYEDKNTQNILTRQVILGLLKVLNKHLIYTQVWDENNKEEITVPFFYDFTGGSVSSERFIQDNYLNWTTDECTAVGLKKIDGDYKPIPCGVISLQSTTIDSGNISNRFVMGRYQKKEDNELKSYVSFLYSIPLTMSFQCSIKCDTMNSMWKIEQSFRDYFYKNKTFHVNYRGINVPVRVGFTESINGEKNASYTMGTQNDGYDIKLNFDITCETYQPVFDPSNERPADEYITNLSIKFNNSPNKETPLHTRIEKYTDLSGKLLGVGQDVILEWRSYSENSDISTVEIIYREYGENNWKVLDTIPNHNFYHWIIPSSFIDDPCTFDLIATGNENIVIHTPPVIKIFPNPKTNVVDEKNVVVIGKGMFFTKEDEMKLPAILSYIDNDGELQDVNIIINIKDCAVDLNNPITLTPFIYRGSLKYKTIELAVRDKHNSQNIASFINNPEDINSWITIC